MANKNAMSSLGKLAILPAKVRLVVWNQLFYLRRGQSKKHRLAILRVNRAIYNEVFNILYHYMNLEIRIYSWPYNTSNQWACIVSKKFNQVWTPIDYKDAIRRGFKYFHWHKVRLTIRLYAPADLGGLMVLWDKIKELVLLIRDAKYLNQLKIVFQDHEAANWRRSVQDSYSRFRLYDFDIAMLPFCWLRHVTKFRPSILLHNWYGRIDARFMHQACRFMLGERLLVHDHRHKEIAKQFECLHALMASVTIHLNNLLDTALGYGSDVLRLQRFANWFEDDNHDESCLLNEAGYVWLLNKYRDTVERLDPDLWLLSRRRRVLVEYYLIMKRKKFDCQCAPCWMEAFPTRVKPFTPSQGVRIPHTVDSLPKPLFPIVEMPVDRSVDRN